MNPMENAVRMLNRLKSSAGDSRRDDHLSLAAREWPPGIAFAFMTFS